MESAQAKNQALMDAGAIVPTSFEALESAIKETFEKLVGEALLLQAGIVFCCKFMSSFQFLLKG